jgi:hypothetical protein
MWSDTVINIFPSPTFGVQFGYVPGHLMDFIEFLCMSSMGPFHTAIELWTLRGQNKEPNFLPLTLLLKIRIELRPPSTCNAFTLNGILCSNVSINSLAVVAVARRLASITSHREITSLAVNCFRLIQGKGRTSKVSTCTRSPGLLAT